MPSRPDPLLAQIRAEIDALEQQLDELDAEYPLPRERPTLTLIVAESPNGDSAPEPSRTPLYGMEHLRQVVANLERKRAGRTSLGVVRGGDDAA
jgi:hypothetical protein